MEMEQTVVLVGCGKTKKSRRCQAQRMYTSTYFAKKREFAKYLGDDWFIISAEHGIVDPEEVIAPYDTSPPDEWSLDTSWIEADRLIVLAGERYTTAIDDPRAEFPLQEFGSMQAQQEWLHKKVEEVKTNV